MNRFPLIAVSFLSALLALGLPVRAADEEPIGYGGAKVQLNPIMAPYRVGNSVRYQVVTVRLILDVGVNERPACFMVPIVHEKFVLHFYKTMPTPADFVGQRKDVLQQTLLDIATATTDRGYYSGIEVVDDSMLAPRDEKAGAPLDPKSQTLSTQCR
jgi:hypothetical protein